MRLKKNRFPCTDGKGSSPASKVLPLFILSVFSLHLLFFSAAGASLAATEKPNTLFLAPKINVPADAEKVTALVDRVFTELLTAKGISYIPRGEVKEKLGFQKAWPPAKKTLVSYIDTPGITYAVTGSITKLGNRLSLDFTAVNLMETEKPVYFYQEGSEEKFSQSASELVANILAHTGRYFLIDTISITGNSRTDSGAILRKINSQPGDRYSREQLRADLENIFKMGYFEDVQILVEESEKGKKVTFQVDEKAVIGQVLINGEDELKEEDIKEVVTVTPNTIINTQEVQTSVKNISKLYKEKGYYNTEVTAKLDSPKPDRVNIQFNIREGFQVYIKEIGFSGNTAFDDGELEDVMITSTKGLLSWVTESGRLKRDILDQDRARIAAMYHNNGYIEAKVSEPEVKYEGKWLYINFNISEGERYRVGTIEIDGEIIGDKNNLYEHVKLSQEKFFSRQQLREDILRLTDFYAENGYAFAEVNPLLNKNSEEKRMDVLIEVRKGTLVKVNRIVIKGNNRTRDKIIRREMQIEEGGILDSSAIRKSSERLQRLEYFEEVNITPEPTAQEDKMNVVVDVKEKATGTFSIGAGYSSVDSLMFMGEISENNFLGKGQRLALQANLSSSNNRYNLSFTEPHLNDTDLLFGIDLYNWEREYDDYTRDSTGAAVRFGYPLWNHWNAFWGYGWDDTSMTDLAVNVSQEILDSQGTTSSVKFGVSKDTRNRLYDPTKGLQHIMTVKYAGGVVGGDFDFTKLEGSTSWYFPTPWETTFHLKGAAGYVMDNGSDTVPVYEKFYLGGINTIRGFDNGKISPINSNNERIGGEKMWYANVEWIFPIIKEAGLKGLVFFDAGNVYDDSETWDLSGLKKSVGFGFRWLSPMGPLRLEWGYNIDPDPHEEQGVWDFSIGGSF